jgi:hypothetical protein
MVKELFSILDHRDTRLTVLDVLDEDNVDAT